MDHCYVKKDKIAVCTVLCEKITPEILRTIDIPQRSIFIMHTSKQQDIKDPNLDISESVNNMSHM